MYDQNYLEEDSKYHTKTKTTKYKLDKILNHLKSKKINVTKCKRLGAGYYGVAYHINKNTVLKVSRDQSEINTMSLVKSKPCKYIVKVIDTFKMKLNGHMRYFIVQEYLSQPERKWKSFCNDFYDYDLEPESVFNKIKTDKKSYSRYKTQFNWALNVSKYFKRNKIKFSDLHSGNIMKRNRQHVLIDLGVSRSPKQKILCLR